MSVLKQAQRKALPRKDFAVPSKAPKSGSYPIPDASHARNALARSAGKPVAAEVKAKVKAKFPGIAVDGKGKVVSKGGRPKKRRMTSDGSMP